jgi:putative membrane protein
MEIKMKYKMLILSLFFIPLSPTFALDNTDGSANLQSTPNYYRSQLKQQEGEILATLITINKNEIAAADEALGRNNLNPIVKEFAQKLHRDHKGNLNKIKDISDKFDIKPVESNLSTSLKYKGHKELAMLRSLDNQAFQVAYAKAMVKGHKEALKILNRGIEIVKNPRLKKHLQETYLTVEKHLSMAKNLENKLRD